MPQRQILILTQFWPNTRWAKAFSSSFNYHLSTVIFTVLHSTSVSRPSLFYDEPLCCAALDCAAEMCLQLPTNPPPSPIREGHHCLCKEVAKATGLFLSHKRNKEEERRGEVCSVMLVTRSGRCERQRGREGVYSGRPTLLQILETEEQIPQASRHRRLTSQLHRLRTLEALLSCQHPDWDTGKIVSSLETINIHSFTRWQSNYTVQDLLNKRQVLYSLVWSLKTCQSDVTHHWC